MTKTNLHIEIVRSTIPSLSSMSQVSCAGIYADLKAHYDRVGVSTVNNLQDLKLLVAKRPDIAFMGLKFIYDKGQKIWISDYLESHGIAHTGSPTLAIELEQDKSLAKRRVIDAGLASARYITVKAGQSLPLHSLKFPLFVKPATLGGGSGVDDKSIVYDRDGLQSKLNSLFSNHRSDVIVEEYLPGREFSVAILKDGDSKQLMAMPIEMLPGADINGDKILSHALKSGELETPVSAVIDPILCARLKAFAVDVFVALGARDYGRIDIRLDVHGQPHFLEANLIPGLIRGSGNFTKACVINQAINHQEMLWRIVRLAETRIIPLNLLKSSGIQAVVAQW